MDHHVQLIKVTLYLLKELLQQFNQVLGSYMDHFLKDDVSHQIIHQILKLFSLICLCHVLRIHKLYMMQTHFYEELVLHPRLFQLQKVNSYRREDIWPKEFLSFPLIVLLL